MSDTSKRERDERQVCPPPKKPRTVGLSETAKAAIDIMNCTVLEAFNEKWETSYLEDMVPTWNEEGDDDEDGEELDMDGYESEFRAAINEARRHWMERNLFEAKFDMTKVSARSKEPEHSVKKVGARRHEEAIIWDSVGYCMWDTFQECDELVEDEDQYEHEVIDWLKDYIKENPSLKTTIIDKIIENWNTKADTESDSESEDED